MEDIIDHDFLSQAFIKEACAYKDLTKEEEKELSKRINSDNKIEKIKAANELASKNFRLVYNLAKKYYQKRGRYSSLSLMDLVAAGNIGLIEASRRFDASYGNKFSTYAYYHILRGIKNEWRKMKFIKAPSSFMEDMNKITKLEWKYGGEFQEDKVKKERYKDISYDEMLAKINLVPYSLNIPLKSGEMSYLECIESNYEDGFKKYEERDIAKELTKYINKLNDKEKYCIYNYYMLKQTKTLREIGLELGVTRERVRQIVFKSIKKLRRMLEREKEWAFL